jgi:hypothetical protein
LRRTVVGFFFFSLLLTGTFLTSMANASAFTPLVSYYGHWGVGYFYPLNEIMNFDAPAENLTYPGPYPYVFTLNTTQHVVLEIRHFLWACNENYSNHLTIRIDGQTVLSAYSPRKAYPNDWYPGGNGVQQIDLGIMSAGTHTMTMTCNISDYYTLNWWEIVPSTQNGSPIAHPV